MCAQLAEIVMGLRQIFAARIFAFVKIRDGVETESIDTQGQPKIAHLLESFEHGRIVEIQVRLMRIKAMPVIGFCDRIPCPVRGLEIFEDDPRIFVFLRRVAPDIELRTGRAWRGSARFLEPRILIGGVIDHQFRDDAQIALMGRIKKGAKIIKGAEVRIDVEIIGDVVAVITQRRRIKRKKPDGRDAELLEIIQFLDQATEIAHSIAVTVAKRLNVQFVDDRVLVPKRIDNFTLRLRHEANSWRANAARQVVDVADKTTQSRIPQSLQSARPHLNREFVADFGSLGPFFRYQTGSAGYAFPFATRQ